MRKGLRKRRRLPKTKARRRSREQGVFHFGVVAKDRNDVIYQSVPLFSLRLYENYALYTQSALSCFFYKCHLLLSCILCILYRNDDASVNARLLSFHVLTLYRLRIVTLEALFFESLFKNSARILFFPSSSPFSTRHP